MMGAQGVHCDQSQRTSVMVQLVRGGGNERPCLLQRLQNRIRVISLPQRRSHVSQLERCSRLFYLCTGTEVQHC